MNELRKYTWIAWTSARSSLAYFGDAIGRIIFFTILLFIFLRLWTVTFTQTGATHLAGLSIVQMLWYLTITEAIMLSGPKVSTLIDEDVRTGAIAVQLLRPMSYAYYRLASTLGERVIRFLVNLVTGCVITFILVGSFPLVGIGVLTLWLTLPMAFILDFLALFIVGIMAFWLEDTSGIFLLYSRAVLIAGGTLIPLDLYPPALRPLLSWLPFANITAGPAHLFVDPVPPDLALLLCKQLTGTLVLAAIAFVIYKQALRRVFVNGG
jgi:ABC-2 type transport system permease protein